MSIIVEYQISLPFVVLFRVRDDRVFDRPFEITSSENLRFGRLVVSYMVSVVSLEVEISQYRSASVCQS